MISICFFEVGQGDAITLEWKNDIGENELGIIDCNKNNSLNPVLEQLKRTNLSRIKFIILTHFHYDHYSGLLEILEYCQNYNIVIENFLHTGQPFVLEFLPEIGSISDSILVEKIINLSDDLISDNLIVSPGNIASNIQPITLYDKVQLSFSGPNYRDYQKVIRYVKENKNFNTFNKIAAITKIKSNDKYIFLPSDSEITSHKRVLRNDTIFKSQQLILAQAPHHGSDNNFSTQFWSVLNKSAECPIVFSVGLSKDKLPKKSVVDGFIALNFDVFSTNCVFGIHETFKCVMPNVKNKRQSELILDMVSTSMSTISYTPSVINKYNGDKSFNVKI